MRKPAFCICENKDADQLRGEREADQRLCFRYTDTTIPLLSKSEISSLKLHNLGCVVPGRIPRRPKFSERGSYDSVTELALYMQLLLFEIMNVFIGTEKTHIMQGILFF